MGWGLGRVGVKGWSRNGECKEPGKTAFQSTTNSQALRWGKNRLVRKEYMNKEIGMS